MNQISYQKCYEILAIPDDADWSQASLAYRKLVQRWHPDRYEGDDSKMAEERFVELTVAFNKLRDYHRNHQILPFVDADLENRSASNDEIIDDEAGVSGHHNQHDAPHKKSGRPKTRRRGAVHSDIRQRTEHRQEHAKPLFSPATKFMALLVLFGAILLTLLFNMDNRDLRKLEDDRLQHRAILNSQAPER